MMKRERERERERVICINTKERRENSFKVWRISCCCCFKQTLADEFCFNFFSRKNLLSQTTEKNNNTNTHIEQSLFVVIT